MEKLKLRKDDENAIVFYIHQDEYWDEYDELNAELEKLYNEDNEK